MKTVFISWENAYENDLVRDTIEACETDDVLSFFEGDPDLLRIKGVTVLFTDIKNYENTDRTVIYLDASYSVDESEIVKRLTEFYNDECVSIESTHANMVNMQNGIAYRGGKGYTYALYEFKN